MSAVIACVGVCQTDYSTTHASQLEIACVFLLLPLSLLHSRNEQQSLDGGDIFTFRIEHSHGEHEAHIFISEGVDYRLVVDGEDIPQSVLTDESDGPKYFPQLRAKATRTRKRLPVVPLSKRRKPAKTNGKSARASPYYKKTTQTIKRERPALPQLLATFTEPHNHFVNLSPTEVCSSSDTDANNFYAVDGFAF